MSSHKRAGSQYQQPITPPRNNQSDPATTAPRFQQDNHNNEVETDTNIIKSSVVFDEIKAAGHIIDPEVLPTSFSPSKARAQAHATHQITVLKTWLQNLLDEHEEGQQNLLVGLRHQKQAVDIKSQSPRPNSAGITARPTTTTRSQKFHPLISRWEDEYLALQQQQQQQHQYEHRHHQHQHHQRALSLPSSKVTDLSTTTNIPGEEVPLPSSSEILRALQQLMYANQTADNHRRYLHEARKEELHALMQRRGGAWSSPSTSTPAGGGNGAEIESPAVEVAGKQDMLYNVIHESEDGHAGNAGDEVKSQLRQHEQQNEPESSRLHPHELLQDLLDALSPQAQQSLTSLSRTAMLLGLTIDAHPHSSESSTTTSLQDLFLTTLLSNNGKDKDPEVDGQISALQDRLDTTLRHLRLLVRQFSDGGIGGGVSSGGGSNDNSKTMTYNSIVDDNDDTIARRSNTSGDIDGVIDTDTSDRRRQQEQRQQQRQSKIPSWSTQSQMQAQTVTWTREIKMIQLKMREYQDRIDVLERSRPHYHRRHVPSQSQPHLQRLGSGGHGSADVAHAQFPSSLSQPRRLGMRDSGVVLVEDVVDLQDEVQKRREVVENLEKRVRLFHGLPPDVEASRAEVRRARDELSMLKRRREELFGRLVE